MLTTRAAAIFALLATPIFAQQYGFTIAGVTVEHGTKQPVPRVLVTITATDGAHRQRACLTDANGAFHFENVAAGKYRLNAERPGQMPQAFHGSEQDQFVTGIAAGPGRDSEHIVFELDDGAKISGTVVDENGEPVQRAQVDLFQKGVFDGVAAVRSRGIAMTNASGRFHFSRLAPGTYFVAVKAQPWYTVYSPQGLPPELDVTYPITYYADSTDPNGATPIQLEDDGNVNIQLALHPVPAARVNFDQQTAQQSGPVRRGYSFRITTLGPGGVPIAVPSRTMFVNGEMRLAGLAPGDYSVTLQTFQGNKMEATGEKEVLIQSGSDPVIKDEPLSSVTGKVTFTPPDHPPEIGLMLVSALNAGPGQQAELQKDGSFQFASGQAPGRYRVQLTNAPEFRVTQVVAKGAEYKQGILDLPPGANVQLSIAAVRAEEEVDGIALKDGKPFAGAMVLLLPLDLKTGQYVGRDQSDSDGTFSIPNVPRGRYLLLAIDDGRDLAYRDPAVLEPYRSGGQFISVPTAIGAKLKVNVLARQK